MKSTTLDLSALKCPLPVLHTRKALRNMAAGDVLIVIATDPMSAIDIPNLVRETGDTLNSTAKNGDRLFFHIQKVLPSQ